MRTVSTETLVNSLLNMDSRAIHDAVRAMN